MPPAIPSPVDHIDQHQTNSSTLAVRGIDLPYYKYQPLVDSASIRLIELQPGIGDSALWVAIHASPYPALQKYEALSYTWGAPGQTHELYSKDGSKLEITTNLQLALRNLRLPSQTRWLWVDAICIYFD
jgi:hypothetical protein